MTSSGPIPSASQTATSGFTRSWLSPRTTGPIERVAYGIIGLVLLGVAGLCFLAILFTLGMSGLIFNAFFAAVGLLSLLLGIRMLVAAVLGRRLHWWPGQREYDRGAP